PLDKRAVQNSEGRLEVKISADESDTLHLIAKKPLTGNFVVRAILTDIKKGQTLGLFAADTEDEGFVVELPAGTYIVEFGRLAGKFKCKVGDKMFEVQSLGKAAPRMTGVFGLSIPAGAQCTVAAVKFTGR
ncbi:MAG: hypothetical protein K8R36_06905, partial [Planctomycetales bacterium]|nr:hypothetical protein [Planctomycetales bacterium]